MRRKLLLLMLCIVMVGSSMIACGKNDSQKESTNATNKESSEGSSGGSSNETSGEVVKLRMIAYNAEASRATYLQLLADQLEGIEIEFEFVSTDNFDSVLNAQLHAGEGPDIIEVGGQTKLLASAGYLLDLTDQSFVSKYVDSGILPYTVEGKVYATPLQSWYEGIFYNKQIFADNGISVPKTWDEFIQIHKTLDETGIKAQTMGAQSYEPMMKQSIALVNNMFYSTDASKGYDEKYNNGQVSLANEWQPAVEEWYKIIEEGCLTKEMLGLSYDQALDEFASGNAAMWESGPWAVPTIMEKNPDIDLGMFPIPGPDGDKAGWLVGGPGSAFAINAKSEHIEEALKVLEITSTVEAQQALVKDNAGSSFVKGVEVDLGDIYADCEEAFKEGHVYAPWTAIWVNGNAITTGYGKSLQEVLAGSKTVKEALEDADKINDDLREAME